MSWQRWEGFENWTPTWDVVIVLVLAVLVLTVTMAAKALARWRRR